jgi:hypothetical protein
VHPAGIALASLRGESSEGTGTAPTGEGSVARSTRVTPAPEGPPATATGRAPGSVPVPGGGQGTRTRKIALGAGCVASRPPPALPPARASEPSVAVPRRRTRPVPDQATAGSSGTIVVASGSRRWVTRASRRSAARARASSFQRRYSTCSSSEISHIDTPILDATDKPRPPERPSSPYRGGPTLRSYCRATHPSILPARSARREALQS